MTDSAMRHVMGGFVLVVDNVNRPLHCNKSFML